MWRSWLPRNPIKELEVYLLVHGRERRVNNRAKGNELFNYFQSNRVVRIENDISNKEVSRHDHLLLHNWGTPPSPQVFLC